MTSTWTRLVRRLTESLAARVVLGVLALLAVVQAASFGAIGASLNRHARSVLPGELMTGERVLVSLLDQRAAKLNEGARLLALDYGFRDAVTSDHVPTIESVLENHGARIGASEAAWLAPDFTLRAAAGQNGAALRDITPTVAHLAAQAVGGGNPSSIELIDGRPHQLVLVPVKAPVLVGWVLMGFPLDQTLVDDLQKLSSQKLTLLVREGAASAWRPALTGLDAALAQRLADEPWVATGPAIAGMRSLTLAGEEFGLHGRWLTPAERPRAVLALVSVSIDAATRTPGELQLALLAITVAAFGVFAVGTLLTTRHVTTPLRELGAAAQRLGAGDFETPLHGLRRRDELGRLAAAFDQMRVDVADKRAQILRLAYWDTLTGLPNRAQFRDAVAASIAATAAEGGTCAIVMLDLDRFKHVNDVLGVTFGDRLLQGVAERLTQQIVRGDDLVARLGGDEFAVLLRRGNAALASSVAQRIVHAFDAPIVLGEHTVDMGAGIGIACAPQHAGDADTLLNRAEVAMVAAKKRASGPVVYEPAIDAASAQTLSLLGELRRAIERRELRLYLQPKLALDSGNVVGAEALVRWLHPERGLVPPMQFIPFAEQTGFIRTLTLWVFEEAARLWLDLHRGGLVLPLSVNLSSRDLLDLELPQKFEALLAHHQVPAEAFCLEITESAIMDDPQRAMATLERLSGLGFRLSIDDFGTGYSSLAYLKKLPVDELKIDKSFVMSMETDADDAKIVRSTIDLAHNLGLSVVAEGVENGKAWDLLRELNCDQAQGYHMSKPMPADEFRRWTSSWSEQRRRPFTASQMMRLH